jgi:hypothetical protein
LFSARSVPPCCAAMPSDTDSPSPVPAPTGLVVKNGSNMRGRTSVGMPGPSSSTLMLQRPSLVFARMRTCRRARPAPR